jgi:CheY-like chemotaxis protein
MLILIVDDEPDWRFILRRFFENAGYDVAEAGNGAAALELAKGAPPDLVVTDVMMPVMDGVELIEHLRADPATHEIPIVAVSGDPHLVTDADAILGKPTLADQVVAVAATLLAADKGP